MSLRFLSVLVGVGLLALASPLSARIERGGSAEGLMKEAQEAFNAGNYEQAIKVSSDAITGRVGKASERAKFHLIRGFAYQRTQKCAEALPDFDAAIEGLEPTASAYAGRAICLNALQKGDRGVADLTKAIELAPEDGQYLGMRCIAHFNQKQYDAAIPDCEKVAAKDPANTSAMMASAASHEILGHKAEALAAWQKLLAADPASQPAKDGVARLTVATQ